MNLKNYYLIIIFLLIPKLCLGDALDGIQVILVYIPVSIVSILSFCAAINFLGFLNHKEKKYRRYAFWFIIPSLPFGFYCFIAGDPFGYPTPYPDYYRMLSLGAFFNILTFILIVGISPFIKSKSKNSNDINIMEENSPPNNS